MLYSVELTVGPDTNDYSIFKEYNSEINVKGHSTGYATFGVNFRAPEMSRGEFGKWASDKNETSYWEKAWYRSVATPLVGEPQTAESYDGRPGLFKAFFDFRSAEVLPRQGSNKDQYSYSVAVFGSYKDNITLQTGPSMDGPWTDLGRKTYTTPGVLQTLKWNNVTLNFDFSMAYFRFKGTRQSKVFEGPFWPVDMNTGKCSVKPERGLSSALFDYSLELKASKKIDVVLNVLDVASKTYKQAGRVSYKNVTNWENLVWPDIQPSEISGSEGRSSYFFTFHYPQSDAFFNRTKQFSGPDIVLVNFNNATVTPSNGSPITLYSFSVNIDTSLPQCDVELQTSAPGSSKWASQGTITYDGSSDSLAWTNTKLDADIDGNGRYRFICGQSMSKVYSGPSIKSTGTAAISFGKGRSVPDKGRWNDTYAFSAPVNSSVETGVKLEIFNPCSHEWEQRATGRTVAGNATVNLTAKPFDNRCLDAEGKNASYRFVASLAGETFKSDVFVGPFIKGSNEDKKKSNEPSIPIVLEPTLNLRYDPIVDIPSVPDGKALQHFNATVIFPYTNGTLKLNITGPNMQFEEMLRPIYVHGNKSAFEKDVQFNSTHAGKTYEISVIYVNPALPGGEHSFIPYSMRVRQENSDNKSNPSKLAPEVTGTVSPRSGVLQAWQESDKLYTFTYSAQLKNVSSEYEPWVELLVRAPGRSWKTTGEKQQYDPAQGNISWTVKPFFDREFLGTAEFKFLIDGAESEVFKGPEIVAIYKGLNYEKSTKPDTYNYFGKVNASINLTIDLLGSDDNIQWKNIGKLQKYKVGSGEVLQKWNDLPAIRYFEFDIRTASGEVIG